MDIKGLSLRTPTILASGVAGITSSLLRRALDSGAGAVVTKSIGSAPREGYRNPTVVGVECGYLNAIGLANPGAEAFSKELEKVRGEELPIVVSLFGSSPEEFVDSVSILDDGPVKAYELNLSCPHVKGVGVEVGQDPELVSKIVSSLKDKTAKPVFVKLSPNVTDIVGVARAAESGGADGITAINTMRSMTIDLETHRPVLSNKFGGLSGPALRPVAVRCVYEIFDAVKVPIIGCGGVTTASDAVEFLLAGSSAVQIGTAVATQGYEVFSSVAKGILKYLDDHGFESVKDIVGLSHSF